MRYKNLKTGAVIDSSFVISGDDWVLESEKKQMKSSEIQEQVADKNTETKIVSNNNEDEKQENQEEQNAGDSEEITKAQIMQELDAFGVEYNPRDKKQVLYDLMMQHGK